MTLGLMAGGAKVGKVGTSECPSRQNWLAISVIQQKNGEYHGSPCLWFARNCRRPQVEHLPFQIQSLALYPRVISLFPNYGANV
jgi:hypothetical protein